MTSPYSPDSTSELVEGRTSQRTVQVVEQRIHHHVAGQMDLVGAIPLVLQVVDRVGRRSEEVVTHTVGDDTIDLFGHRPVAATQTGFDVSDQGASLGRHDGASEARVDVADQHHR